MNEIIVKLRKTQLEIEEFWKEANNANNLQNQQKAILNEYLKLSKKKKPQHQKRIHYDKNTED